jgi:hypothetical protein
VRKSIDIVYIEASFRPYSRGIGGGFTMAQETLEQQLYAARIEIARLQEVIRKMKLAAKKTGGPSTSVPGAHRGY